MNSRRLLQIMLGVLCAVPLFFGSIGLLQGAERFMPAEIVTPNADSQIRYMFGWYLALPALMIYIIPRIEREGTLLRIIIGCVFFGGLMRLVSIADVGVPDMQRLIVTALELGVIALIPWQASVARKAKGEKV